MADNDAPQELNLEQILQTLANLPQAQNVMQPDHHQSLDSQPAAVLNGATLGSFSSIPKSQLPNQERSLDPRLNDRNPPQHHPASSRPQPPPRTATPAIDPATITDWKHGLRCVSKIAAQNPGFEASIRKLIQRQEQSVREWNTGRTRLIEEQRVKRENEQTQRAAISLPGILANMPVLRTPGVDQEELDQFHQKVYRASCQMAKSQSAELKRLGVPFFEVRPDLILLDDVNSSLSTEEADSRSTEGANQKISKKQLLELQRKMLNHLTELYGD